jgi:hypothetical protein
MTLVVGCSFLPFCYADETPAPLPTPAITGPLKAAPPHNIGGAATPGLAINGAVTGIGLWQANYVQGDVSARGALSNGQVFLQKTDGWWQFYVQAGAYNIPSLGTATLSTEDTVSGLYGPVPVAYLKIVPAKNTSFLIGALPTLVGAESTFTFQNMNIERGLLWVQENAVNRGVQVNQAIGKFTASLSWNDGYYSNRYSWLSGSLTYTSGPHSVSFQGMGNMSETAFRTLATPVQNDSTMYALIYTYSDKGWIVQPYFQYSDLPASRKAGIVTATSTVGGAVLVSRALKRGFSLTGRFEYLSTSGSPADGSVNVLYGPGSAAWSGTVTPTFQRGPFFVRADFSLVQAEKGVPGYEFGTGATSGVQPRGVVELGFLF